MRGHFLAAIVFMLIEYVKQHTVKGPSHVVLTPRVGVEVTGSTELRN